MTRLDPQEELFVVECDHHDSYSTDRELSTAKVLCDGCCESAQVVKYHRGEVVHQATQSPGSGE